MVKVKAVGAVGAGRRIPQTGRRGLKNSQKGARLFFPERAS
jgi:hypothetical protein